MHDFQKIFVQFFLFMFKYILGLDQLRFREYGFYKEHFNINM